MKKTYEEIREFYGLKIGDKIKVELCGDVPLEVLEDCLKKNEYCNYSFSILENAEYIILGKEIKQLGDLICSDFVKCNNCPLSNDELGCYGIQGDDEDNLFTCLEKTKSRIHISDTTYKDILEKLKKEI